MGAARVADASNSDRSCHFHRRWDAPPLKLKRPPLGGTSERAEDEISSNEITDTTKSILSQFNMSKSREVFR